MACSPAILKNVPLFALLDEDGASVLAGQVQLKTFAPRQRIYKRGDPGGRAYVMVSGTVRVTTGDEDHQQVLVDQPKNSPAAGVVAFDIVSAHLIPSKRQSQRTRKPPLVQPVRFSSVPRRT